MKERVLAVITARSGSKGLTDKNIRNFAGEPLLACPILTAKQCSWIDRIVLSTDSEKYAALGKNYGAEVPFLRSAELASDTANSMDVLIDLLDRLAAEGEHYQYLLLLEPTSPLTEASDLDKAMELLLENNNARSIMAVREVLTEHPAFCVKLSSDNYMMPLDEQDFSRPLRRQDLTPVFCFAGSFYLSTTEALRQYGRFYHPYTLGYRMPSWKTQEIDDLADFICAEALYQHRDLLKGELD